MNEDALVAACRRGEQWAQAALFEQHHRPIYRFLLMHCRDPVLAEDLVQDTFVRGLGALDGFDGRARVRSWLTRIALNLLYESGRRADTARRASERLEAGEARGGWARPSRHRTPDIVEDQWLREGLQQLDENDRTVILLHDLQGHRYREIAEILGIAVGTVGSRLARARERLRDHLVGAAGNLAKSEEENPQLTHRTRQWDAVAAESAESADRPRGGITPELVWNRTR